MAGLVASLMLIPSPALAEAEQRSAGKCDTVTALKFMGNAVGMLPGYGQVANVFGELANIAGVAGCKGITIQQITAIAKQQAKIVYESATLDAAVGKVDDKINQFASLKKSYGEIKNDEDRRTLVGTLDGIWRLISDNEQDVKGLSFQALPAVASMASLKLSVLTAAYETETLSIGRWRELATSRVSEAEDSLRYLAGLESKLNQYTSQRFMTKTENISYVCNSRFCTRTYRVFAYDKETGAKSAVTVLKKVGSKEDPGRAAAYAKANNRVGALRAGIRNPYITPEYVTIRQGLKRQADLPVPPVFQLRTTPCNKEQYIILQSVSDPDLVVTATAGSVDVGPLGLTSGLAAAKNNPSAQFRPIRYGSNWIYKIHNADLTLHGWGGDDTGVPLVLHGDPEYAEAHTNSLFTTYITWDDELIFKVSSRDRTIGLAQGQQIGSKLVLGHTLNEALSDADSRFRFTCWPQAR